MMKKDKLFDSKGINEDFTFNDRVAEVFDDMLSRSVPFYSAVIDGIAELLRQQAPPGSIVYDLGCSTGTTLLELSRRLVDMDLEYRGIDIAPAMLEKARRKAEMYAKSPLVSFIEDDIMTAPLPDARAVICNYTLQFIRPPLRPRFIRRIYDSLPPGGLLYISEKIINHDKMLNRVYIDMFHRFKRRQGYSELEIAAKREALENVLVPFSIEENLDLIRQAGFASAEPFFQWFNFASFVAVK
ncbi:MAG: carboxy-S-adenosyl-L-methionine synthase CmoA [Desulfobulbaceae bacterium]|nr:carboxy-S-adenosyl-L-methionine synthase CmoA [Desulfobulbaceae bacterium]